MADRIAAESRDRTQDARSQTQIIRRVRVRLQTDLESHEAESDGSIPAGRWAWCKILYGNGGGGWVEKGERFRVWDPWNSETEGYQLSEGDDAKAEYVRWGVNRYEFYDAPCKE